MKSLLAHQISAGTKNQGPILKRPPLVKHIQFLGVGSQLEIVKQYYALEHTRGSSRKMLTYRHSFPRLFSSLFCARIFPNFIPILDFLRWLQDLGQAEP